MKHLTTIALLFCICFINQTAIAQPPVTLNIDSLKLELTKKQNDTSKIKLFQLLADQLRATDPSQSSLYLEKAFALLQQTKWDKGLGIYYQLKGRHYGMLGNFNNAILSFDSSLIFFEQANMKQKAIKSHVFLGMCYQRINNYIAAYESFKKGLLITDKLLFPSEYIDLNESLAAIYDKMGNMQQALEIYKENEAFAKSQNNTRQAMISKGNIGQTLAGMGQYDKGLELLLEGLDYFDKTNDLATSRVLLINIAYVYGSIKNYEEALKYLIKAKEICKSMNSKYEEVLVRKNLSQVYIKLGKKDNALQELNLVLADFIEMGDSIGLAKTHQLIGNFYKEELLYDKSLASYALAKSIGSKFNDKRFDLSIQISLALTLFEKKDYIASEKEFDEALLLAKSLSLFEDIEQIYAFKSQIAEQKGHFKEALDYYKKHITFKDSVNIQNQLIEIEKIKFTYEAAVKDEEIKRLEADSALNLLLLKQKDLKYRFSMSFLGFLIIITFAFILLVYIRKNASFKTQEAKLKLLALRAQMNPHFIFNALASIQGFVLANNKNEASDYLLKFSSLMRKVLDNSSKEEITLSEEIEMLRIYLDLEAARLNNKFTYSIYIDPKIKLEETLIPPLLIQPFIENSVWHGIANKKENGEISLRFELNENTIDCIIQDNGIGRAKAKQLQINNKLYPPSMGLKITKDRLAVLDKKKKLKQPLVFEDLNEGLKVKVKIPLNLLY